MLQNAYLLAKIGADTAENEQHFAEILPKTGRDSLSAAPRGPLDAPAAAAAPLSARGRQVRAQGGAARDAREARRAALSADYA